MSSTTPAGKRSVNTTRPPESRRIPRLIYNDDTCSLRYLPKPHTEEKIHIAVDYLKGTQVDVFCWCMSGQSAYAYRSKKVENYFDLMRQSGPEWCFDAEKDLMMSLYEQGIDYLPQLIERTHQNGMRFFASFRMNDCHHRSVPDGALTPQFWKTHQSYRLWEVTDALSYYNGLLDYSHAEVRTRMLDMIFEVAEMYDIDGVELDMGREPYYFQPSEAWAKRGILTEFVKTVQRKVKQLSLERGKDLQVLIRTPYSEERLKSGGMDVWTWIKRGYLDILAMNSMTCQNDYNQRVEPYLGLCRQAGVLFYPSIENGPLTNWANHASAAKVRHNHAVDLTVPEFVASQRAMAENLLAQGVDGLHLFNYQLPIFEAKNYFAEDRGPFRMLVATLAELGDRKTLAGTDKLYFFLNDLPIYAESNRPKQFHQTVPFTVFGSDAKRARRVTLSFRQVARPNPHAPGACPDKPLTPRGYVEYYVNGKKVSSTQIRRKVKPAGKIPSGFELGRHHLLEIEVPPRHLCNGENTLALEIPHFPQERDPYVYIYELKAQVAFT
jgi:hypothetical protein